MKTKKAASKALGLSLPVVLLLTTAIFAAGCVGQGGNVFQSVMDVKVSGTSATEDTTITAKIPEFARADTDFSWQLVVQPIADIKDFKIFIDDTGLFTDLQTGDPLNNGVTILANRTQTFNIKYRMGDPGLAEKTNIKLRSTYVSNASTSTTVAVLSDTEYFQRKAKGTLGEIPTSTWTSTSPLQLTVSWSDTMPLLDKQNVQMYVDYKNTGSGIIENLMPHQAFFSIPSNLEPKNCDDYTLVNLPEGNRLELKNQLDFIQNKAKRSTCTFVAHSAGPIDSTSITGWVQYTYEIDNTITVPIIQK